MAVSRELSLKIDVKNVAELNKLTEFVNALRQAGPIAKGSMREAAEATRAVQQQLNGLTSSVADGFKGLQLELQKVVGGFDALTKAAKAAEVAQDAGDSKRKRLAKEVQADTEAEAKSVRQLRAEYQKLYEAQLSNGRSNWKNADLRQMRTLGVQLSPLDSVQLKSGVDYLGAVQTAKVAAERAAAQIARDWGRALAENLAREAAPQKAGMDFARLYNSAVAENLLRGQKTQVAGMKLFRDWSAALAQDEKISFAPQKAGMDFARMYNSAVAENLRRDQKAQGSGMKFYRDWETALKLDEKISFAPQKAGMDFARLYNSAVAENLLRGQKTQVAGMKLFRDWSAALAQDEKISFAPQKAGMDFARMYNSAVAENLRREQRIQASQMRLYRDWDAAIREDVQRSKAPAVSSRILELERDLERMRKLDAAFNSMATTDRSRFNLASKAAAYLGSGGTVQAANLNYGESATSIAQNSKALAELAVSAQRVTESKRQAAGATTSYTKDIAKHLASVQVADQAYQGFHSTLRGMAGGFGQIWLSWGRPLTMLWAGFAASSGIRRSVRDFMEFQNSLTMIQAIAGETDKSIASIGQSALRMGENGIYGANQIAQGIRVLTQAGLTARQAIDAMPTVNNFATLAEMDPNAAAKSLLGINTAFGRPLENLSGTADIVAKAAAMSQTSVEGMTEAIRQSSTVAEQFGADLTEVSAVLAVLAKRNIEASAGGTALRNAYNEIYTPGSKAQKVLNDLKVSAFDAQKNVRPLVDIFTDLRKSMTNFDSQSQLKIFQTVFGERGGKVGSAILTDLEGIEAAAGKLRDASGFVSEAAIIAESSVQNQWKRALNTLESAFIQAGSSIEGSQRQVISALRDLFNDSGFREGLSTLVRFAGELTVAFIQNIDTILKLAAAYAILKVGLGGLNAITQISLSLSVLWTARKAQEGAASAATAAAKTAEAAATTALANAQSRVAGSGIGAALGTAAAAAARFVPQIAAVGTVIWGAMEAWNLYKVAQDRALAAGPPKIAAELDKMQQLQKYVEDRETQVGNLLASRGPGGVDSATLSAFESRKQEAKSAYDAQLETLKSYKDPRAREAAADEFQRVYAKRIQDVVALEQRLKRANEVQADEAKISPNSGLPKGVRSFQDLVTKPGGLRSYVDPIGSEQASDEAYLNNQIQTAERAQQRQEQILRAKREAFLITEDELTRALDVAQEQRANLETAYLRDYLTRVLPEYEAARRKAIEGKYTGEDRAKQLEALEAQMRTKTDSTINRLAEADTRTDTEAQLRDLARLRVETSRSMALSAQERKNQLQEERLDAEQNAQLLPAIEQKIMQRRLAVRQEYLSLIEQAEKTGNKQYLEDVTLAAARAEEVAAASARRRAEIETSFMFGAQRGVQAYLDQMKDASKSGEQAVSRTFQSMEDALVEFVTKGKLSFSGLIDSMIADLARFAMRKQITEPLGNWLTGGGLNGSLGGFFPELFTAGPAQQAAINVAVGAAGMHSGGIVGKDASFYRSVPAAIFAGAPRFHTGGMIGSNEVPIIAERGERVLTKNQQMHIENALSGRAGAAPEVQVNVINNGTAQQVSNTETQFDGKKMIVNVILEDMARNGPISRRMNSMKV